MTSRFCHVLFLLPLQLSDDVLRTDFLNQVMRDRVVMVNIMRDIPREATQPLSHSRLLLCAFVLLFDLDDHRHPVESWPSAHARVEATGGWDARRTLFATTSPVCVLNVLRPTTSI